MDVMDAVVGVMEDEGVEVAFGVPGAAILPLYRALSKSDQRRHYSVRHEEGGAEEYALRPTSQDAEVIRDLIKDADELFFDMERRVLILRDLD